MACHPWPCLIAQNKDPKLGAESIKQLMDAVDSWIPLPKRDLDKPFLMPIESAFSIAGRGTVVTGKVGTGLGNTC